ncbi:VOC family protein [Myceligenerans indicum]|uniref:2,3-dihydroxybiphenyl 1,2-dioxygenase n=1 Tax=Myceligenerans indicum TaxID=2593663 RepID=A0ABS1LIQ8_9MICO|nr:VOC family protein [Myceligenerans indicum]MBL0885924.1 2,3-dihydroxybiphenyl 1,2-dioxygenase [Myceligenerans indicum]
MGIRRLGHVGLNVSDVDAWVDLFDRTLGVKARVEKYDDQEVTLLELDEFTYRLALYPSTDDAPRHIGWVVDDERELDRLSGRLEDAGHAVSDGTTAEARLRGATALRWFSDPVGYRVELVLGEAKLGRSPSRPPEATPGVTGLGHFVLASPRLGELRELYESVLEFKLTDYRAPGLYFLRCNATHHSLALAHADQVSIHHLEIEHGSLDDVGRALDRAQRNDAPISISLGRHMNDKAISFYLRNPSGFHLEIGFGGIEVDGDRTPHDFGVADVWGHHHADANPFATPAEA